MSLTLSPNFASVDDGFPNGASYSYDDTYTTSRDSRGLNYLSNAGLSADVAYFIDSFNQISAAADNLWAFYNESSDLEKMSHSNKKLNRMHQKMINISRILFDSIKKYIEIEESIINNYINSLRLGIVDDKTNKKNLIKMLNKEKSIIDMNIKKYNNL